MPQFFAVINIIISIISLELLVLVIDSAHLSFTAKASGCY